VRSGGKEYRKKKMEKEGQRRKAAATQGRNKARAE
jgi:hypothetical protein